MNIIKSPYNLIRYGHISDTNIVWISFKNAHPNSIFLPLVCVNYELHFGALFDETY